MRYILLFFVFINLAQAASEYKAYLVVDRKTLKIIKGKNYNKKLPIASLTKLMTAQLIYDSSIDLNKNVEISTKVVREKNSKIGLKSHEIITIGELLNATLIYSANDAAYSLGEILGNNVIDRMNKKAKQLGMKNTKFTTTNGYPHKNNYDLSTCYDMVLLSKNLIDKTPILDIASKKFIVYKGKKYPNHNKLIGGSIKGLKTGYFRKAGFNIIIVTDNKIVVILGSKSKKLRNNFALKLIGDSYGKKETKSKKN